MKDNNKKIFLLIFLIVVIVGILLGYWYYKSNNNEEENAVDNNEEKTEKVEKLSPTYLGEKVSSEGIYGFTYVYNEKSNTSDLYALNSKGNDIKMFTDDNQFALYIKNNRLLFTNNRIDNGDLKDSDIKSYYIDLTKDTYQVGKLTDGVHVGWEFDFNDEYLFTDGPDGIVKYNLSTKERETYEESINPNGFFIDDNKLYYSYIVYGNDNSKDYYCYIDFEGNKQTITKDEFDSVVKKLGYKEENGISNTYYYIKNGKKVSSKKDAIIYDGKVIYSNTNQLHTLDLIYSPNVNEIAFKDIKWKNNVEGDYSKYYIYDISTGKTKEIEESKALLNSDLLIK